MTSVSIIGGYGGMGRLFAKTLKGGGFKVTIAGPRPERGQEAAKELGVAFEGDNLVAVKDADIVIITVPITKTIAVIQEVVPHMKKGALLMDLTSVKKAPCEAMMKAAPAGVEVVGCHPVFGPMVDDFKGQNFVFCPLRAGKAFLSFKEFVKREGARITECQPEEHDQAMGVVQGMTHFMLISAGVAMRNLDFDVEKSKAFSSPVYQLAMDLIGRILAQDPKLYAEIQIHNPETARAREAFLKAAQKLENTVSSGYEAAFVEEMTAAARHFGDTKGALERTNKLLKK